MIFRHKRTGKEYKLLFTTFSVERQTDTAVYLQLDTGFMFDREFSVFKTNFELVNDSPQMDITPHDAARK